MKKTLLFLTLSLFIFGNSYANNRLDGFNKWLFENGHTGYFKEVDICKEYKKYSKKWYESRCEAYPQGKKELITNLDIKFYESWIPEENVKPNYETLVYELFRFIVRPFKVQRVDTYEVEPSSNPYEFRSSLKEDKYIDKQLKKTALLSYLLFEDGQITIDKISPNDRFGKFINNETKLRSMSVGRSMASYTLAHAICDGYIDSFDTRLDDWPLLENTLYYNQKLSDILNMNSGDHKYIEKGKFINSKNLAEKFRGSLDDHMVSLEQYLFYLKNTKSSKPRFNYNSINSTIALNYVLFKTGDDFEKILEKTFKDKAKIKNSVLFYKTTARPKKEGNANIQFYATRYDYLRIAKAMLDDWQNDTCEGKYLKSIFNNRISKENEKRKGKEQWPFARGYAGQFQAHYKGIDKKRAVMGMHGYGGQHVVIDFDNSRIVVTNAIHENFNYAKIVYGTIKKGK
jgi:Asp-tRNA(Asn)/Glu-tRNA(Gln) amidotransferase C subunit